MTEPSRETPPEATEPASGEADEASTERTPESVKERAADGPDATGERSAAGLGPSSSDGTRPADDAEAEVPEAEAEAAEEADGEAKAAGGSEGEATVGSEGETKAAEVSEAQAELAAQRELRARIEQRKAEKAAPVDAGGKLSGTAADLLAAVRAVESGTKPGTAFFEPAEPAPRRPAPTATPAPPPVAAARPPAPERTADPETLEAVQAVLARGGAPEALTGQVADALGEGAAEALREDPWLLLSVPGVQPEHADGFARALLGAECGPGDPRRAVALVTWLLERAAVKGHTALEDGTVRAGLGKLSVPDPDEALRQAVSEGAVLVFQDEEPAPEDTEGEDDEAGDTAGEAPEADVPVLLGLDRYALAEESLADGLARLVKTVSGEVWEGSELVRAVGAHGLVLHTGGEAARSEPVALAEAARGRGLRVAVAVHSENGVRRLGTEALTVAALLSGTDGPGRDAEGAFALDLLVVLDAPQLDVESAAMLVESLPDGCRLVLGGDPGVLGSAGAGRVFGDVLAAGVCPRIASRLPDPGPIGELVSGIGIGELNQVEAPGKEVVIVPVRDAGEAVHRTVQLAADSIPRAIGVPTGQTQVITVGHGGSAGTRALNAALKQRLNPGPGRFGGFDPGDRVAYVPAPGRTVTGTVLSADAEGLRLECEGERLVVPKERVESALRHGWALTAHQAAGMRWPAAVVVLPGDAAQGLSRAWVYTAFGRGERHLSVVHGVDQALPRAVAEGLPQDRTTRLGPLLEGLLAVAED